MTKAYIINFERQSLIEPIIDDGRPYYQRLRDLGVLFDEREDAERWLSYAMQDIAEEVRIHLITARCYLQNNNPTGALGSVTSALALYDRR